MSSAPAGSRICFLLRVRPERAQEYRGRHAAVWPEMLDALRETGWRNYSIFLREDGTLVGYLECDDFAAAQAAMQRARMSTRAGRRRWRRSSSSRTGVAPDAAMTPLAEIFHLD